MCTFFGLTSPIISILKTIASHDPKNQSISSCNISPSNKCIDDKKEPLIINKDPTNDQKINNENNKNTNNFDNYWQFVCIELRLSRLQFLINNIFTSLLIPHEIWNLILEYELDHPIHAIIYQYLTAVKASITSIYIIPYFIGYIQFIIVAFILSGFSDTICTKLYPSYFLKYYNIALNIAGIILISTSTIQIICCIYSILTNYTTSNIMQLSKLKQAFYQKKDVIPPKKSNGNVQHNLLNNEESSSLLLDSDENKLDIDISQSISSECAKSMQLSCNNSVSDLVHKYTKINTIDCEINYTDSGVIEWRIWFSPERNQNNINKMTLTVLQPWELLISAQKWCNVLYVQNMLYFTREYVLNKLDSNKSALLQPNVWFILCKPLFICLLGLQYLTFSSYCILLWIPYCTLLCFLVWRCVFNVSFYASICWSIIVCCLEFWEVSTQTKWWISSLETAESAAYFSFDEIFILIGAYSLVYLCQKTNKILLFGVWPAWIICYALYQIEPLVNTTKNDLIQNIFNLMELYCMYVSIQFLLFSLPKYHDLKRFHKGKFILCSWLFAWLDVQSLSHLYHDPKLDLLPC